MRQIILYPRGWILGGECPSLQGCVSQGKTKEQAIENMIEAISLYLETLMEEEITRKSLLCGWKINKNSCG